jgi:plastocyanin
MICTDRRVTVAGLMLAAVLVAAPAGAAAPRSKPAAAPAVHTVVIDDMKFGPVVIEAKAGDVVEWVNKDMFRHTATARDKSFDVDLKPGASGRVTLKTGGVVKFFCRFHPGMTGEIRVSAR